MSGKPVTRKTRLETAPVSQPRRGRTGRPYPSPAVVRRAIWRVRRPEGDDADKSEREDDLGEAPDGATVAGETAPEDAFRVGEGLRRARRLSFGGAGDAGTEGDSDEVGGYRERRHAATRAI